MGLDEEIANTVHRNRESQCFECCEKQCIVSRESCAIKEKLL